MHVFSLREKKSLHRIHFKDRSSIMREGAPFSHASIDHVNLKPRGEPLFPLIHKNYYRFKICYNMGFATFVSGIDL